VRDLWAQFDIVEPGCAGRYWAWAQKFCGAFEGQYGWDDRGSSNLPALKDFAAHRTHVVRSEEVYKLLPPIRRMTTYLSATELTRADKDAGVEVRRAAKGAGGGTGTEGTEAAKNLLEARLIHSAARKSKHVAESVVELLNDNQKVLVFTGRRRDVTSIFDRIRKQAPAGALLWAADGETPPDDRETIREDYMAAPGPACIVGTGAAWGESVNLHDTDRLIIVLLPWTWGQIRQQEGRVRRLGMQRSCIIEYIVAEGTVDERIAGVVLDKLAAVEAILPDEQVTEVRESVQGGTDDNVIDGLLDRFMED
jgi:SNF2 family DNA or RNA helicase